MFSISLHMDQSIIASFKERFVKLTFSYILKKLQNDGISLTEVWKKFSILDCSNHATAAIPQIKQHTLIYSLCFPYNSFKYGYHLFFGQMNISYGGNHI